MLGLNTHTFESVNNEDYIKDQMDDNCITTCREFSFYK